MLLFIKVFKFNKKSIGLIIGIENLACEKLPAHLDDFTRLYRPLVYSPQPFDNSYCSLTFLATYFFSSCLLARWLTIAFLWHWMIWRRIDPSQLDRSLGGNYSNAFAFLVPVVSTILLLMTRHVEVSELTGLCTLGTLDADMLFKFVIFPSSVCLIIGLLFILAGYRNILVMRIRNPDRESR